jgi:hypothetical protein
MKLILTLIIFSSSFCFAQKLDSTLSKVDASSTYHSNSLSLHPFGVFISRIGNNFQLKPKQKSSISVNVSNGNIWLPNVKTYSPINEVDRAAIAEFPWHKREHNFDTINTPSKTTEFHADGVIRHYQIQLKVPISDKHELTTNLRMFSFDKGSVPSSLVTSDQFIEWVHSNIAGGEDPFARRVYGLNQAKLHYNDENGKTIDLKNGDVVLSGIDLSYFYFPSLRFLERIDIYSNLGLQVGANLTNVNPTMDVGLSTNILKRFKLNKNQLFIGANLSALRMRALKFGDAVQLSNKNYLFTSELFMRYVNQFKNGNYFSIATSWIVQSTYRQKSEFAYLVLTAARPSSHWHNAASHLYEILTANTLTLSYGLKNIAFWIYVRQDIKVDNAPDVQTGVGLTLSIH